MTYTIIGLGNPGPEYEKTRHNTGRIVLDIIAAEYASDFEFDKKANALLASGKVGKDKIILIKPETFMNNSGKAVAKLVKSAKSLEKVLVIYDDFQLPLGRMKISFDKSSGGHNGLESVIKCLKTTAFPRLRIGTARETAKGDAKIPHGDKDIEKFILGEFKPDELKELKKAANKAIQAVHLWVKEGREKATNFANTKWLVRTRYVTLVSLDLHWNTALEAVFWETVSV